MLLSSFSSQRSQEINCHNRIIYAVYANRRPAFPERLFHYSSCDILQSDRKSFCDVFCVSRIVPPCLQPPRFPGLVLPPSQKLTLGVLARIYRSCFFYHFLNASWNSCSVRMFGRLQFCLSNLICVKIVLPSMTIVLHPLYLCLLQSGKAEKSEVGDR
jgi:hypothetical protein